MAQKYICEKLKINKKSGLTNKKIFEKLIS